MKPLFAHESDPPVSAAVVPTIVQFELLLSVVIGFLWGPSTFYFLRYLAPRGSGLALATCAALTVILAVAGARAPEHYFSLRRWERRANGRAYERWAGIRFFKQWMMHGDRMNAMLRRLDPDYRAIRPTREALVASAERTVSIERAHLAWFLGALPIAGYALSVDAPGFALLWTVANLLTNVWPMFLQRYNRVRLERVQSFRT